MGSIQQMPSGSSLLNKFLLTRKTFVITGAGRGLGLSFAHAVAQVGGNVVAIDVHDTPDVEFQQLSQYNVKAKYYQ